MNMRKATLEHLLWCTGSRTILRSRAHPGILCERIAIPWLHLISLCGRLLVEPGPHAERVYANAKQVCRNKTKL